VLLAHGSRDARWRQPFEELQRRLAGQQHVELSYLQSCPPTIEEALRRCREQGAEEAVVVPLFMSGGGHLLRDVPERVAAAASAVPGITVTTTGAAAEAPEVLEALAQAVLRLSQS
jgi:sirohydrochlorin cobaltochelatase